MIALRLALVIAQPELSNDPPPLPAFGCDVEGLLWGVDPPSDRVGVGETGVAAPGEGNGEAMSDGSATPEGVDGELEAGWAELGLGRFGGGGTTRSAM